MSRLVVIGLVFLFGLLHPFKTYADDLPNELPECIVITHCVRENWEFDNAVAAFEKAVKLVSNTPRTKIVESNQTYIHAEAQTKWRRYTDDLLMKVFPEKGLIQIRSESRVGVGDNGVNKKRVDELFLRLEN